MIKMPGLMLIDDTEIELEEIRTALNHAAIPCLPILFDKEEVNGGLDKFELENFEPRIIISDLNLKDSTSSRSEDFYPTIAKLLQDIAPNKPYVIYFWSKHDELIDDVMDKVLKSLKQRSIFPPLGYGTLKKSEFSGAANSTALQLKVKNLLAETPYFNALYDWESRVADAAQQTSLTLIDLANKQTSLDSGGLDRLAELNSNLDTIISTVANEALGAKNAKNAKEDAVDIGLMPVLQDHLHTMNNPQPLWEKVASQIGSDIALDNHTVASLNSFYHTAEIKELDSKNTQGVFVPFNSELMDGSVKQKKLEGKLGIRIEELVGEEFLTRDKLNGMSKPAAKKLRKNAREATTLGFIELSADCDHAQRKVRLHRYVLCALIPKKFERLTMHGAEDNLRTAAHAGIYRLPEIAHNGESYILKLSFRYQIGTKPFATVQGVDYENKWLGEPILRLREQILADISFKCAQYATRPGIISFR